MKVKSESEVAQSCLTLSDPMDCSLLGSFIHGIFQARVLEWGAIAFSYRYTEMIQSLILLEILYKLVMLLSIFPKISTCFPYNFFKIFYYYYFLLYNIVLVLPYINMHPPRVYGYKFPI